MPVSHFAEVPPILLWKLADELTDAAVEYRKKPFRLRAGGVSNWYIEGRGPAVMHVARGPLIARLALAKLNVERLSPEGVVGMGVGGRALAYNIRWVSGLVLTEANDSIAPDQRYGYGLHGASVQDKDVLVVDDTLSTGDSLMTTIDMVRDAGGRVVRAMAVFDRSDGIAAERVEEAQSVKVDWLFGFNEADGKLFPNI